jgi:hypothetical protein
LREQVATMTEGDPEFLTDAVEGETNLFEVVDKVVLSIKEDEALAKGIAALIDDLKSRKKRIEDRADFKRAMVGSALEISGIQKREGPAGTVSLKSVPPKVVVTDESLIPSRFWKPQAPTLDKSELGKCLKARAEALRTAAEIQNEPSRRLALQAAENLFPEIPGATLGNGSLTVAIR